MVFSYIGDPLLHPQFAGMVLRLRKISLESSAGDSQDGIFLDAGADEPDDPMIEFQHSIMERLISPEHLPRLLSVRVEHEWLHDLVNLHDGYRPPARRKKDCVDLKRTKAVIATDLVGGNGLAVEIKVKRMIVLKTCIHLVLTSPISSSRNGPSCPRPLTYHPTPFLSKRGLADFACMRTIDRRATILVQSATAPWISSREMTHGFKRLSITCGMVGFPAKDPPITYESLRMGK